MTLTVELICFSACILINSGYCFARSASCPTDLSVSKLKLISLDESNNSFIEDQPSIYDITEDGLLVTLNIKSGLKCVQVKYGDETVWEHDHQSEDYPIGVSINPFSTNIRVRFARKLLIYSCVDHNWSLFFCRDVQPVPTRNLDPTPGHNLSSSHPVVVTLQQGPSGFSLSDVTHFSFINSDLSGTTYKLEHLTLPIEIHYEGDVLWKSHDNRSGLEYPKVIYANSDKKSLTLDFTEDLFWFLILRGLSVYFLQKCGKFNLSDTPDLSFLSEIQILAKTGDKSLTNEHDKYDLTLSRDKVTRTYRFKKDVDFYSVVFKDRTVWLHNSKRHGLEYPKELVMTVGYYKMLKIKYEKMTYIYRYGHSGWVFASLSIEGESYNRGYFPELREYLDLQSKMGDETKGPGETDNERITERCEYENGKDEIKNSQQNS